MLISLQDANALVRWNLHVSILSRFTPSRPALGSAAAEWPAFRDDWFLGTMLTA